MSGNPAHHPLKIFLKGSTSILLSSMAMGVGIAQTATAEAHAIDIQSMTLEASLNELAEQIDKQIVIASVDAADFNAPGLSGTYSEATALNTLLAETDLSYSYINDRTIAIVSQAQEEESSSVPLTVAEPIQTAQTTPVAQPVAASIENEDRRVL
ncbi:MAG: STN domain-containing protein, partial [Pseudomonadota bacterium]